MTNKKAEIQKKYRESLFSSDLKEIKSTINEIKQFYLGKVFLVALVGNSCENCEINSYCSVHDNLRSEIVEIRTWQENLERKYLEKKCERKLTKFNKEFDQKFPNGTEEISEVMAWLAERQKSRENKQKITKKDGIIVAQREKIAQTLGAKENDLKTKKVWLTIMMLVNGIIFLSFFAKKIKFSRRKGLEEWRCATCEKEFKTYRKGQLWCAYCSMRILPYEIIFFLVIIIIIRLVTWK